MITPLRAHQELLDDIRQAAVETSSFHLWWLGQSGFLVQWQGEHLLLDPYLSDSLTEKYADTDRPHVRMTELVVEPDRLDFVDVVTSSHNHTDHLDAGTLIPLLRVNPSLVIVVPAANRDFAADRLQVPADRLSAIDEDSPVTSGRFTLQAVPAAHETVEKDEKGRYKFVGYIAQFGPWTLYHGGDTVRYEGQAERLRRWPIDVAILPINGRGPERGVAGNLWGHEAAQLAHDMAAKLVIPCHYDMFTFNTATPTEFGTAAQQLGQPYRVLRCGERWSSDELGARYFGPNP